MQIAKPQTNYHKQIDEDNGYQLAYAADAKHETCAQSAENWFKINGENSKHANSNHHGDAESLVLEHFGLVDEKNRG